MMRATQSFIDCHVAGAPRSDEITLIAGDYPAIADEHPVIASAARQSMALLTP